MYVSDVLRHPEFWNQKSRTSLSFADSKLAVWLGQRLFGWRDKGDPLQVTAVETPMHLLSWT